MGNVERLQGGNDKQSYASCVGTARRFEVHNRARTDRANRPGAEPQRRRLPGGRARTSVGRVYGDYRSAEVRYRRITAIQSRNSGEQAGSKRVASTAPKKRLRNRECSASGPH